MGFSSGAFSLSAGNPVVTGSVISSTVQNNTMSDVATNGLSLCVLKDGSQTITANIPFGGFKITGLAAGSAANDSVRLAQLQTGIGRVLGTIAGTNTITAVGNPVISAYATNQLFTFIPAATNTAATTINIDGLGAKNIFYNNLACDGGELIISIPATIMYDGTQFQLVPGSAALPRRYIGLPINSQSAAYTTVLADQGKAILHPVADTNNRTFTIDSNANVAYPVGTVLTFINQVNTVTIAITADTLVLSGGTTTGSRTLGAYGNAAAVKLSTTLWLITGVNLS